MLDRVLHSLKDKEIYVSVNKNPFTIILHENNTWYKISDYYQEGIDFLAYALNDIYIIYIPKKIIQNKDEIGYDFGKFESGYWFNDFIKINHAPIKRNRDDLVKEIQNELNKIPMYKPYLPPTMPICGDILYGYTDNNVQLTSSSTQYLMHPNSEQEIQLLKEQIQNHPRYAVAKMYNVSERTVSNWMDKFKIQTPSTRGQWISKTKQANKKLKGENQNGN